MRTALLIVAVMAVSSISAVAEDAIRIMEPWARASILASRPGAAYLTIESARDNRLLSIESPIAGRIMIHTTETNNDVNRMVHRETLELSAGEPIVLAPGGTHLMLMDLKVRLIQGAQFPVTLTFERGGAVTVSVPVIGIAATGPTENAQ